MLVIDDILIPATVKQVVEELREQTGYFNDVNDTGQDLMVTCPNHSQGQERNPSCGILKEDRGDTKAGTTHCYTCGYVTDIVGLVKDCKGYQMPQEAFSWLTSNFLILTIDKEERPLLELDMSREQHIQPLYIPEKEIIRYNKEFQNSEQAIKYMESRCISMQTCNDFKIGYNKTNNSIMIPINNREGQTIFYKERLIDKKVFLNQKGISKANYIFGLDKAIQNIKTDRELNVWVCESEIDALTIYERGDIAIALLGSHISRQQEELLINSPIRNLIDGLDRDKAGRKGSKLLKERLASKGFRVYLTDWGSSNKKDINELTEEEYKKIKLI